MELAAYRDALAAASADLATAAGKGLDVEIAHCPGWTMAELVRHTGVAQRCVDETLRLGSTDMAGRVTPEAPTDHDRLVEWFEEGAELLAASLAEAEPGTELWKMWPTEGEDGVRFWHRHIARETDVHRWDAQAAHGGASPMDPDLAADGLDDLLGGWLVWAAGVGRQAQGRWSGESVQFRRTDGDEAWVVTLHGPGRVSVARGAGPADATVAGTASDLLLFAVNRLPPTDPALEVAGDTSVVSRWASEVRFGRVAGT